MQTKCIYQLQSFNLQRCQLLINFSMQLPSTSLTSSLSLPSTLKPPLSMEPNPIIPNESFSYSLRLSFDTESFIEFDPKLSSTRWSFKSHHRHEDKEEEEEEEEASSSSSSSQNFQTLKVSPVSKKNKSSILVFRKYLWFVLLKVCRRMKLVRRFEGNPSGEKVSLEKGRGSRVFHLDTESSIDEAVLHCKNSNLSSLMDYEV